MCEQALTGRPFIPSLEIDDIFSSIARHVGKDMRTSDLCQPHVHLALEATNSGSSLGKKLLPPDSKTKTIAIIPRARQASTNTKAKRFTL